MPEPQIRGGAGTYETAAVMAAVQAALTEEAEAAAQPEPAFVPGPWVIAGRPRSERGLRTGITGLSPLLRDRGQPEEEEG